MRPIDMIPDDVLARELEYVARATGFLSRVYRAARAALRCARIARRVRRGLGPTS